MPLLRTLYALALLLAAAFVGGLPIDFEVIE